MAVRVIRNVYSCILDRVINHSDPPNPPSVTSSMDFPFPQDTDQLEYLIPKKTSLKHRLPIGDPEFVEFIRFLLTVDPDKRPTAAEALEHPWMSFPYDPINA